MSEDRAFIQARTWPKSYYISFLDRSFLNKILWFIYKAYRSFYVSVWFYFLPFVCIIASYTLPLMLDHGLFTKKVHS